MMDKNYQGRIERVIQYIDSNLDKKLTLVEVAKISHFSQFHFHRIFGGLMGETINDYIGRRRLERAANMLVFKPDMTITEVAYRAGFSSSANFSKAVKVHFGYSPSDFRKPEKVKDSKIGKILSKYGKDFNPADLYPNRILNKSNGNAVSKDIDVNVEIKELESRDLCILASTGGYDGDALFETWDKINNWATGQGINSKKQQRFALCYDNPAVTPVEKCRYEAAIVVDSSMQVNSPFTKSVIPEGKYAVLYFKGSPEETGKASLGLYTDWLPSSGFEPDDFPMLEHYLNDVREDGYVEMEIYIKLKRLS